MNTQQSNEHLYSLQQPDNLNVYESTISCYELVASFLLNGHGINAYILEQMENCLVHVNSLIASEKDQSLLENLLQLKAQMTITLENIRLKIKNQHLKKQNTISRSTAEKRSCDNSNRGNEKRKRTEETAEKKMMHIIENIEEKPDVQSLNEIVGLCDIKKILKTMILLPQTQPQLFTKKQLCNTILLYGPPGTGKTRIVHALAAEAKAKLYTLSGGNILSSYVGQTEETIQAVFKYIESSDELSVLFIDEIDGLCRKRTSNEHDYSRRLKTELMCQLSRIENSVNVFVVCATNCPWDLDTAILRRFQRRLYVPLPNPGERLEFFKKCMNETPFENKTQLWNTIVKQTEGYSGSDLTTIVKHALNNPITELEETKIWKICPEGKYQPISGEDDIDAIVCCDLNELPPASVQARPLTISDILYAVDQVTPTVSRDDVIKYELFSGKF